MTPKLSEGPNSSAGVSGAAHAGDRRRGQRRAGLRGGAAGDVLRTPGHALATPPR